MKNNAELRAALNMVLARLDSEPKTAPEWDVIQQHLYEAYRYADEQVRDRMRKEPSRE